MLNKIQPRRMRDKIQKTKIETPSTRFLNFALPTIGDEECEEVIRTLRGGWLTYGPKTKLFEERFSNYIGVQNSIAVNSATSGLHLALLALGIGPGDEVIVPVITFCSTANVVVHMGARPVFCDVSDDLNIDVSKIRELITDKTKAIIPVHFAGQACDMDEIGQIAKEYDLKVIEDAAHAVGSAYRNRKIGTISDITVFSFYPTKNMTAAEGGMVTTQDNRLAEKIRILSMHGISKDAYKRYQADGSWYYEVLYPGYKYNMTDIQAAIGIHQLRKLPDFIEKRQYYVGLYNESFRFIPEIIFPMVHPDRYHTWHLYVIGLEIDSLKITRGEFINLLKEENIGSSVHFIPLHFHPYYRKTFGYKIGDFPKAEWFYERIVSLPLYPKLTESDIYYIIFAVRKIIESARNG